MTDDTILPFSFPAVHAKKVTAAFDGGRLTSNGGVMLLAIGRAASRFGRQVGPVFPDRRDPTRVVHSLVDMFRARMFAICCGYEDADDLDSSAVRSRIQAGLRTAAGHRSRSVFPTDAVAPGECSAPARRDPLTYTLVDAWMDSYPASRHPSRSTSMIPAMSSTAISSSRCSTLIMTNAASCRSTSTTRRRGRPVAVVLRPGKTPGGVEVRAICAA